MPLASHATSIYAITNANSLVVPYDNENLLSDATNATASPFVIAAQLAGVGTLPGLINAVLLCVVLSAANSNVYSGSRILVGLASEGLAPQILAKTTNSGVPYVAVGFTAVFGLLGFMNEANSGAQVFNWFINISGVAGFISWACIGISHLAFIKALKAQGVSRDSLPYKAMWQPWFSWYGVLFNILIILTQGFTSFIPWNTSDFFVAYVSVILFVALYVGHKVVTRSKFVRPEEVDLATGRIEVDEMYFGIEEEPKKRGWGQVSGWLLG